MSEYTFGAALRAARLGYHAVPGIGFVRIRAGTGNPPHVVDVAPFDGIRPERGKHDKVEYRVWWDDEESRRLVCDAIRKHVQGPVTRVMILHLDDDGEAA